jgi:hypothetical protein
VLLRGARSAPRVLFDPELVETRAETFEDVDLARGGQRLTKPLPALRELGRKAVVRLPIEPLRCGN